MNCTKIGILIAGLATLVLSDSVGAQNSPESELRPIIMVSYPAIADKEAAQRLRSAYSYIDWPANCGGFFSDCYESDRTEEAFDRMLLKTGFYVEDLVHHLAQKYPDYRILVQPGRFACSQECTALTYTLPNNDIPAAVRIDFAAHSFPFPPKVSPSYASTHGKFFTPAFTLARPSDDGGSLKYIAVSSKLNFEPSVNLRGHPSIVGQMLGMASKGPKLKGRLIEISKDREEIEDSRWAMRIEQAQPGMIVDDQLSSKLEEALETIAQSDVQEWFENDFHRMRVAYKDTLDALPEENRTLALETIILTESDYIDAAASQPTMALRQSQFGESLRKILMAERELHKESRGSAWSGFLLGGLAGGLADSPAQAVLQNMQINMVASTAIDNLWVDFETTTSEVERDQIEVIVKIGDKSFAVKAKDTNELRTQLSQQLLSILGDPKSNSSDGLSEPSTPSD